MSITYNHVQLSYVDSNANVQVFYPKNTGSDVSIDRNSNTNIPSDVTTVQLLANKLTKVSFSNSYSDLTDKPTFGTAASKNYTTSITSGSNDLITSGAVNSLKETLAQQININGAKNILPILCQDGTHNGITIANNGEYLTVSGTATGIPTSISLFDKTLTPVATAYGTAKTLTELGIDKTKKYVFSRPSGAGNIRYNIWLFNGSTRITDLELNSSTSLEIDFTNTYPTCDRIKVSLVVTNGVTVASGTAFKPMLCLKSDYDLDNSYTPWVENNYALTRDKVGMNLLSEVGAVNYLPKASSADKSNIHFIVDSDGVVSITTGTGGNAPASGSYGIYVNVTLKPGTYKLTSVSPNSGCYAAIAALGVYDYGDGAIFTVSTETTYEVTAARINDGAYANGIKCYPMIAPVSYTGPYVPYAKSNKELTDLLSQLDIPVINNLVSGKLFAGISNLTFDLKLTTMNIYWTDNVEPTGLSTTQQRTDAAQAVYDLHYKCGGDRGAYIGWIERKSLKANGDLLGSGAGLFILVSNSAYSSARSNNSNSRYSLFYIPYGTAIIERIGIWGTNLSYSNIGLISSGDLTKGILNSYGAYNTISTYKG